MDLYHLRPYDDFYVEYGPILVFLPYWFHRIAYFLDISHEAGYYVLHYLLDLVGLLCLAALICAAQVSLRFKRISFALLGISAFAPQMGLNGLALRYIGPYFGVLKVHFALTSNYQAYRAGWVALATTFFCLPNASLSPEIGVAFFLAAAAYGAATFQRERNPGLVIIGAVLASALILPLLLPRGYFHTFVSFALGADNFPIVPAPHIVLYLIVALSCIPILLAAPFLRNDCNSSILFSFGVLTLVLMPGALGRCDPWHVFSYGLGLFTLTFLLASWAGKKTFFAFAAVYALVFIVGLQVSNARAYRLNMSWFHSMLQMIYQAAVGPGHSVVSDPSILNKAGGENELFRKLSRYPTVGLPYGSYGYTKSVQEFLWSTKKIIPEKYMGAVAIYTSEHLAEKLDQYLV